MEKETIKNAGDTGLVRKNERVDNLGRKGLKLIQNEELNCFGMDAVLLSAFACAHPGERVLDLGTGTGIIPTLMYARYPGASYTGLEIHPSTAQMARRSVQLNHLETEITIVNGDIREAGALLPAASFHVVTANPPYMKGAHGLTGENEARMIARHETLCTFEDVARAAAGALKSHGRLYLVHRPFRLTEIIRILSSFGLEPKRMRLVYPMEDREPNMVLIEALKGGRPYLKVESPLIVYERPGVYTRQLREIYEE